MEAKLCSVIVNKSHDSPKTGLYCIVLKKSIYSITHYMTDWKSNHICQNPKRLTSRKEQYCFTELSISHSAYTQLSSTHTQIDFN